MAENFDFTPGTGATGAADDIAGVKYPKVKLVDGTEDSTTVIGAGVGAAANGLRVALATASEIVANLSATDNAVLDAIQTAIEACQTALEATLTVSGTVTANLSATDNAVLDAIQTAVEAIQTAITGTVTIDGTVDLGATDNAVLDSILTAVEAVRTAVEATLAISGTVDLGATDNAVLDTIATNTGAALTDTELRATPVPVSGTVTANLSATDNAVLDAIQAAVEIIDNAISGTEMQVDIASAIPAGTNLIGKVSIDQATANANEVVVKSITAGDNNIGNVDLASAIPAGTNNMGTVAPYAQPANFVSGATADITDTTATSVIAAQGAGVVIYLTSLMVTNSDADTGTVVKVTDGSGGTTMWRGYACEAGGGFAITFPVPLKFTANTAVYAVCETTGATVQVSAAGYKA